jgi:2-amino-4-hydroxy-6-hydroxymethyldihydropteridine diphosphokinase
MSPVVYIALGSNLGDRPANLKTAVQALQPSVSILDCSPIYETPPWGYVDQPAFLNRVVKGQTQLSPGELLDLLKRVEADMGRQKTMLNGPRLIDLDILFYDNLVLDTPQLTIPHPRMGGRGFVLVPLADLAPDLRHPILGATVREMLNAADRSGITPYPSTVVKNTTQP